MTTESSVFVPDAIRSLRESFALHLDATRADKTMRLYLVALDQLIAHLEAAGMPSATRAIRREHVESYFAKRRDEVKPSTLSVEFRALQQFWKWALDEDEIEHSPMEKMKAPRVPRSPVPVVSVDDFRKLLKATSGKTFNDRRDAAVFSFMFDTGCRRREVVGLAVDDVDLRKHTAFVTGKAEDSRVVVFGSKTAVAIDRYLRLRRGHRYADSPDFWLGQDGPLSPSGLAQVLARRAAAAGLPRLHPHQLRHSFANEFLADGGSEGDLMRLAGWKSRQMLDRYGASAADSRARAAYRSPVDRL